MRKILIVDDHCIVRTGLKVLLRNELAQYIFEEAADGDSVLHKISHSDYELIILDINIPGTDPYALVKNILILKPQTKILMFSMNDEHIYARRFLQIGAKGYISKDEPVAEIRHAVKAVLNNHRYISKLMSEYIADDLSNNNSGNPFEKLSPRQLQIVRYLVNGKSVSDICQVMQLHSSTVSTQKSRIFEKLRISNLVDLYNYARIHLNTTLIQ